MPKLVTVSVFIVSVLTAFYLYGSDHFDPEAIQGKRVLVTGASSGIGEELAYQYAKLGTKLVITARRAELLEKVAEKCRKLGAGVVETVTADMSIPAERERLAKTTEQTLGGLDILILNHANIYYGWWEASGNSMTVMEDMLNVGFLSYVHLTSLFLKSLEESRGYIGVSSSVSGKFGAAGLSHYTAMKHALQGFYATLRQELRLRETGVSVTLALFSMIGTDNLRALYRKNFPNASVESRESRVEDAAEVFIRAVAARAYEAVYPKTAQVFLIINRICPQHFENFINWFNERLRNQ